MSEHERSDRYEDAIRRLQEHLVRNPEDRTFRLTIEDGGSIGIDPVIFAELKRSLEEMNKLIRSKAVDPEEVEFMP